MKDWVILMTCAAIQQCPPVLVSLRRHRTC